MGTSCGEGWESQVSQCNQYTICSTVSTLSPMCQLMLTDCLDSHAVRKYASLSDSVLLEERLDSMDISLLFDCYHGILYMQT